ncbi:MAG: histone deacetylase [Bacteroidia bacterium]
MLKIAWSDLYRHPLPEGHRFPMEKYNLIPEQLLYEGTITEENLYNPGFAEREDILLTHAEDYLNKLQNQLLTPKEIRRTGFPLSPQLIRRSFSITNGTIQNTLFAMKYGVAINGAGGTHHAFADRGEGFCLLNDIAIAANWLLANNHIQRALIVDLDVHQGNGTAAIFQHEPRVFTFSMHCEANYPLQKEKSDLDIGLNPFTRDEEYLQTLKNTLPRLLQETEPDMVFYLSGVDILSTDRLGKLSCTREGCKQRDAYVLKLCHENELPVVISLGGGYSYHIRDIVEAHCNTFRLAQEIWF